MELRPLDSLRETFGPFLLGNPSIRDVFMKHHADLLDPAFWQAHKQRILAGHVHDVFPYDAAKRFKNQRRTAAQQAAESAPTPSEFAALSLPS